MEDKENSEYCTIDGIPEELYIEIPSTIKIERIIDKLLTYKKLGIQVFHLFGNVGRLKDCPEVIAMLSRDVSIFVEDIDNCPECIKRYIENA